MNISMHHNLCDYTAAEPGHTPGSGGEVAVTALPGPAVHRRAGMERCIPSISGHPRQRPGGLSGRRRHRGVRQRPGRRGRHHERRDHHHPRQRGGRGGLRHAGRAHLRPGRRRLPGRHPHESLPGQAAGARHRRPGRQLSGGVPGRRHHRGAGPDRTGAAIVGNFPCTGMHGGQAVPALRLPGHPVSQPGDGPRRRRRRTWRRSSPTCGDILPPVRLQSAEEMLDAPFTVVTPDSQKSLPADVCGKLNQQERAEHL